MCEKAWSKERSRSWSKLSEPARADSENEHSAPDTGAEWCGSLDGKPSDVKTNYYLTQLREELSEIRKRIDFSDDGVALALASVCNLERHIAAQEKKSQETVRSPEKDHSVAQKISELRESLEGSCCPQGTENSSSSKEEEYVLVAPIKGVDENGRLLLGDRKILSASALKI